MVEQPSDEDLDGSSNDNDLVDANMDFPLTGRRPDSLVSPSLYPDSISKDKDKME